MRDDWPVRDLLMQRAESRASNLTKSPKNGFALVSSRSAMRFTPIARRYAFPCANLRYVSIIDCRRSKNHRAYFRKWHELGHFLILTDQRRFAFKRTLALHELKSPEESMVDVIAGEFAYYDPMVRPFVKGKLTFEAIDHARQALCPEGSYLSALFGLVKVWSVPCLLVEAQWAGKRSGEIMRYVQSMSQPMMKRVLELMELQASVDQVALVDRVPPSQYPYTPPYFYSPL